MKTYRLNYIFLSILALMGLLFVSSCKPDEPTVRERNMKLLTSATWRIASATINDLDATSSFSNMTLTFNAQTYTAVNGGVVWPQQDTWSFKDGSGTIIVRGDGIEVTIVSITKTSLVLSLEWNETTIGSGRARSIPGTHEFSFTK